MSAPRRLRIAQIMLAKRFGGAERSFVDLCVALARRGHEVLAIGERRGLALRTLAGAPAGVTCHGITVRGSWDALASWQIRQVLRTFAPAIVQAHLARAAAIGGKAAHDLGIPTLAKTHNYVTPKYYRHMDRLVPTTIDQQNYLVGCGIPRDALRMIPNFSSLATVAAARREVRAPPIVFALGRLVHKKGFDVLLHAFARLAGGSARLVIAGAGPEAGALHALAVRLGIAAQLELPGWVDAVEARLRDADVFVLPSRDEPFGIAVLEAMALGVPIVATRTAGPVEILAPDCALLVPPDDPPALAAAMAQVLDDRAAAAARAGRALERFRNRYSEAVVVPQYEALYAELLAAS